MKCKNCGADISDNAKVCKSCGAFIDDENGYVLLTSDDIMDDIYANEEPKINEKPKNSKGKIFIRIISLLLTLAIIGGGAFWYFTRIYDPAPEMPALSFKTGSGIINDDEKIIYVLLDEKSNIEYIHGVSLYDYDATDKNQEKKQPVSTDYEYTKSIDSTFRAIFFDADKLTGAADGSAYTFEMNFSFNGSDEIYTYKKSGTLPAEITEDASDLIFDHSLEEETTAKTENQEPTTEATTQSESTTALGNIDFIYNFYWFTEPYQNEEEMNISAIKFNRDNTYVSTSYYKNGDENWQITTYSGNYKIEDGYAVLNNGEATESTYYKIDAAQSSLHEEENGAKTSSLTPRKYNSLKNVEEFFGI